jgi:adenylate kinase
MTVNRHSAILLLGPTGSGKTPLGHVIEGEGLGGRRFVHFDFGENLRQIVAHNNPDEMISREDIDFLRGVLQSGVLLEDEQFPLANRIFRSFLARRMANESVWVVLNGLPRHVGQARGVDAILDVRGVVCLECSGDTIVRRLASNVGGDRAGRLDDDLDRVQTKLEIFRQRTAPLVDHYRRRGARIETIEVTADMTAKDVRGRLLGP